MGTQMPSRFRCAAKCLFCVDRALTPDELTKFTSRTVANSRQRAIQIRGHSLRIHDMNTTKDDGPPELLTVKQVAERWRGYGITEAQVRRLYRRKVLRASPLRKKPLLFHIKSVIAAEEGVAGP